MDRLRLFGSLLIALQCLACEPAPTREHFLSVLVERTLVPDHAALAQQAAALTSAARAFVEQPDEPTLRALRTCFRETLLAWQPVYVLRTGPVVANKGLLRALFWPVRERQLDGLLERPVPLSAADVDQLGVDLRGMFALEYVLFGDKTRTKLCRRDDEAARMRKLAHELARNAQQYAQLSQAQLKDSSALVQTLRSAGQENVSRIVNQMIATIEDLASGRLARVLEMQAQGNMQPREVQGGLSASSSELVRAQLRAVSRIYLGSPNGGLAALVKPVAPQIDRHLREHLERADTALAQVREPLESLATRDRAKVEAAFRALKDLELALKVDLASALAVTLTFTAGDGD